MDLARRGDSEAFGALVEPYLRELQAHSYRILGSTVDAEDALQETLLSAWRGLSGFGGLSRNCRAWAGVCVTGGWWDGWGGGSGQRAGDQLVAWILSRLETVFWKAHSPLARGWPRIEKRRNPRLCLMSPKGPSAIGPRWR